MAITTVANTAGMGGTQIIVPAGATAALLITAEPGEIGSAIKAASSSGGSLMVFATPFQFYKEMSTSGVSFASTWASASLIALGSSFNAYPMSYSEVISISGAARYYIMSVGATTTIAKNVQYSQGL